MPKKIQLSDWKDLRGLGKPMVVAIDTKSIPGHVLVHSVRMDTTAIRNDLFNEVSFDLLGPDADPRAALVKPNPE